MTFSFDEELKRQFRSRYDRFIVTGAGGWLGRAALELLDNMFEEETPQRVVAYASTRREYTFSSGRAVTVHPLDEISQRRDSSALIYHFAYLGKEKVAELGRDRFTATNRAINETVEGYCRSLDYGGLFFSSSGAAHFAHDGSGDLDREPYGQSKIEDEQRFLALKQQDFQVAVCRVFNMGGPFINKLNAYALSCIILDLLNDRDIILHADRPVFRSYVHVRDVIELGSLLITNNRCPSMAYDTAALEVVELGELAERCAAILCRPNHRVIRPPLSNIDEDRYVGEGAVFQALSRELHMNLASLDQQILDTADYLRARRAI